MLKSVLHIPNALGGISESSAFSNLLGPPPLKAGTEGPGNPVTFGPYSPKANSDSKRCLLKKKKH